jgi:hypothetical protein
MSRSKLRRITLGDEVYLWGLVWGNRQTSEVGMPISYETLYRLTCWRDGFKHSPAIIHFTTWEDAMIGGPLHTGAPLDLNMPNGLRVNLNRPAAIAKIIRYLKSAGWHPEDDSGRLEIQDGQMLLPRIFEAVWRASSPGLF